MPGIRGVELLEIFEGGRPFPALHAVLRTGRTVTDCFVYVGGHLRPVIRFTDVSVHAVLSEVPGQYLVVSEVEYTRSERVGEYNLDELGVIRMLSSQEAVVPFEELRVEVPRLPREYGLAEVVGRLGFE